MEAIGLYRLNELVKQALQKNLPGARWVIAEIADIKENHSGHCYLELVEKREEGNVIIASSRAVIWAHVYRLLKPAFETITGQALQRGLKVLLEVEITFHELYGYSLNIKDIDLNFTLGNLERERREILDRLTREGVIDMNRSLPFPDLPKSVAIISSLTAAGYEDFVKQLRANAAGYLFHTSVFQAAMQGEKSAESIIDALERVHDSGEAFDVVVIVRGGGSRADLNCFNSYDLALNVACFPLPVLTGIGHERDESIVDRVAYKSLKTPTAVADFLLKVFQEADSELGERQARFVRAMKQSLQEERQRQVTRAIAIDRQTRSLLERQASRLAGASREIGRHSTLLLQRHVGTLARLVGLLRGQIATRFSRRAARLEEISRGSRARVERVLAARRHSLELAATKATFADPRNILERGYSIARVNGKVVRDVSSLKRGDILETELLDGRLESEVKEIKDATSPARE
ncbi:MAG: exodeoxyribonuclease VII large subunit [Odoribacteraceae bacterium]|jgi:exodeoxyribonuclease VII large subunit|nr:exodeoxyribonuclease VII large subunit [Odoribacteraceae bacterium]